MLMFCFQVNEPSCVACAVELYKQRVVHMVGEHTENHSDWRERFECEKERRGRLEVKCDRRPVCLPVV